MAHRVEPSIRETAFSCPYCNALTTQYWFKVYPKAINKDNPIPLIPTQEQREQFARTETTDPASKAKSLKWVDRLMTGRVFFEKLDSGEYVYESIENVHLSKCFNCKKVSIWVHDSLVTPRLKVGPPPNSDLPDDIASDFEEAREIANESPRGAAALLRLCVEKLCARLGSSENSLDENIAVLVKKGLSPLVQRALDIVRVVGNEAVHPGIIDLRDDRDTAVQLFGLINSIADQMITHPKSVEGLYSMLPEGKRRAIENRDKER